MPANSQQFVKQLGQDLIEILGPDFSYARSKLELRRAVPEGHDVIALAPSSKSSPDINLAFYFGKRFSAAQAIEQAAGTYQFPYHIQQYSLYRQPLYAEIYQGRDNWGINIHDPPSGLAAEIAGAITGMAFPWFQRYRSLVVARDAMAADSPDCFGGPTYWKQLLRLDVALNDLSHFRGWYGALDDWSRGEADKEMAVYLGSIPGLV